MLFLFFEIFKKKVSICHYFSFIFGEKYTILHFFACFSSTLAIQDTFLLVFFNFREELKLKIIVCNKGLWGFF